MVDNKDSFAELEDVNYIKVETTPQMNEAVFDLIDEKLRLNMGGECQTSLPVFLVAQTEDSAATMRSWIGSRYPFGVSIVTFSTLIRRLWDIFGNGTPIASAQERTILCNPALRKATGSIPTVQATSLASAFVDAVHPMSAKRHAALSSDGSKTCQVAEALCREYEMLLLKHNRIDLNDAVAMLPALIEASGTKMFIISEDPSENDRAQHRMYRACSRIHDISVIRRDATPVSLVDLAQNADITWCAVYGWHAQDAAICSLIQKIRENGVEYKDIAVSLPDTSLAYPNLMAEMAFRDIPFNIKFSMPFSRTLVGQALLSYARWSRTGNTDEVSGFMHSTLVNAEKIIGTYEGKAIFTLPQDEQNPLDENGMAFCEMVRSRNLDKAISWLEAHLGEGAAADEHRAIISYARTYLATANLLEIPTLVEDLSASSVSMLRSYGEPTNSVTIISETMLSYTPATHLIVCGFDDTSSQSYFAPGAFAYAENVAEVYTNRWIAKRGKRLQVADVLTRANNGIVDKAYFVCCVSDKAGNEVPPGTLWTEMVEGCHGKLSGGDCLPKDTEDMQAIVFSEQKDFEALAKETQVSICGHHGGNLETGSSVVSRMLIDDIFSPTDLESYWNCPYKWFSGRNGAGYIEYEAAGFDSPLVKGNVIHNTANYYYRGYGKENPRANLENDVKAKKVFEAAFAKACQESMDKCCDEETKMAPHTRLVAEAYHRLAYDLICEDADFLPGFSPAHFEDPVYGEVRGTRIGGIVDRVDFEDGDIPAGRKRRAVIVDYKGSIDREYEWDKYNEQPGLHIQTLLYVPLIEKKYDVEVVGVIYRSYAKKHEARGMSTVEVWYDGSPKGTLLSHDEFDANMTSFLDMFEDMIGKLRDGKFPIEPRQAKKAACNYCPVKVGCNGCPRK